MIQLTFDGPGNADRDMTKFLEVLSRAITKYQVRDAERKGVWRRGGVKGQVRDAYAKSERLFFEAFHYNDIPVEDDLIDLINYAVFALILLKEGDNLLTEPNSDDRDKARLQVLNGAWPW